ncbi:MAG: outer membrane lipoprotein carrier protein LolA [Alphaproteobacteria bacterium]|nr:outer membrane lipoprotein carrier protein LolA [Alphaproteobacteria bacterium]
MADQPPLRPLLPTPHSSLPRRHFLTGALALAAIPAALIWPLTPAQGADVGADAAANGDTKGKPAAAAGAIKRVETYLNGVKTLSARFLQIDAAGTVTHGQLYLRRPGRLRFEYDPPSPLLLVADGVWLILHDKELDQVNRFPLYETPLGVLVDDPVNLREKVEVVNVEESPGILRLKMIDRKQPDEGWMDITFTEPPILLRQWKIRDAQGGVTALSLTDIRVNQRLDPELFTFTDPAPFHQ